MNSWGARHFNHRRSSTGAQREEATAHTVLQKKKMKANSLPIVGWEEAGSEGVVNPHLPRES